MPRAARLLLEGGIYHVTSRGNNKAPLFGDDQDLLKWLELMRAATAQFGSRFHAYCLMTNHIHLVIETRAPNLDETMKWIKWSYSKHFDAKYGFVGHLYDGRYKSKIVLDDKYFLAAIRYVHRNPVAAHMVGDVGDYRWTSHHDYLGVATGIADPTKVLSMFSPDRDRARQAYLDFVRKPIPTDELKKLDSYRNGSLGQRPRKPQSAAV